MWLGVGGGGVDFSNGADLSDGDGGGDLGDERG